MLLVGSKIMLLMMIYSNSFKILVNTIFTSVYFLLIIVKFEDMKEIKLSECKSQNGQMLRMIIPHETTN